MPKGGLAGETGTRIFRMQGELQPCIFAHIARHDLGRGADIAVPELQRH